VPGRRFDKGGYFLGYPPAFVRRYPDGTEGTRGPLRDQKVERLQIVRRRGPSSARSSKRLQALAAQISLRRAREAALLRALSRGESRPGAAAPRRSQGRAHRGEGPGRTTLKPAARTFEAVARDWYANRLCALDAGHAARLLTRLERDAFPMLGARDIRAVTSGDVLGMVRVVEAAY